MHFFFVRDSARKKKNNNTDFLIKYFKIPILFFPLPIYDVLQPPIPNKVLSTYKVIKWPYIRALNVPLTEIKYNSVQSVTLTLIMAFIQDCKTNYWQRRL